MIAVIILITAPVLLRVRADSYAFDRARRAAQKNANKQTVQKKRAEALNVLKLPSNASKEQIQQAHKKLMRKNHPDLGGSKFLATKINVARDVLLDEAA